MADQKISALTAILGAEVADTDKVPVVDNSTGVTKHIEVSELEARLLLTYPQINNVGTGNTPQFTGIEVGHASDTTLTRTGAGVLAVEGVEITTNSAAQTLTNKTLIAPALGTPASGVATNLTGTAAGLTVGATTGVEAGADVTDTANVTAAGALMDSELTSIASVKALDQGVAQADSPTFVGGTFTGDVSVGGGDLIATADVVIRRNTADASDTGQISIKGGGGSASENWRGAEIIAHGNEHATNPGDLFLNAGTTGGVFINGAVVAGSPTGGAKGTGTINATAVYDDNVLLTCYPFDAYFDGVIDDAKWDAKVPNRIIPAIEGVDAVEAVSEIKDDDGTVIQEAVDAVEAVEGKPEEVKVRNHDDMRKFKARLGGVHDPLDIDKYWAHIVEKRHLPSMPNEDKFDPEGGMPTGSWIQRLIETVEIQAVHIHQLNERIKVLEAK